MPTPAEVKAWFDGLDDGKKRTVDQADDKGTAAAASVRGMLLQADLIEPAATDGEVLDTLKMRH